MSDTYHPPVEFDDIIRIKIVVACKEAAATPSYIPLKLPKETPFGFCVFGRVCMNGNQQPTFNDSSPPNVGSTHQGASPAPTCTELLAKTLPRYSLFNAAGMTRRRCPIRSGRLTVILHDKQDEIIVLDTLNNDHLWL
jgi:hypothetical protein